MNHSKTDKGEKPQMADWKNEDPQAAREAARRLQQQLERAAKAADARQEKLNEALAQSRQATSQAESARAQLQETLVQTRHELAEARGIAHRLRSILHQAEVDLPEGALAMLEYRRSDAMRDPDGLTSHAILEFRALVETP